MFVRSFSVYAINLMRSSLETRAQMLFLSSLIIRFPLSSSLSSSLSLARSVPHCSASQRSLNLSLSFTWVPSNGCWIRFLPGFFIMRSWVQWCREKHYPFRIQMVSAGFYIDMYMRILLYSRRITFAHLIFHFSGRNSCYLGKFAQIMMEYHCVN